MMLLNVMSVNPEHIMQRKPNLSTVRQGCNCAAMQVPGTASAGFQKVAIHKATSDCIHLDECHALQARKARFAAKA